MHITTSTQDQAVAIVGVACRLPGGIDGPDELWQVLRAGRDVISEPPQGRFHQDRFLDPDPARPGTAYSFAGGYLRDIAGFDAGYFGVSPREAEAMDPQQRLLLELAAEAFADAGLDQHSLGGTDTAVFVGLSSTDYEALQETDANNFDVHSMTGIAGAVAANRLSYAFDLRGPSMTVDAACASALFALDQACRYVRGGRGRTAVAGAAQALLNPLAFVGFSKAKMLSPTHRCRTFSADADGYVRAEGGGVFVLKRLDDALADGDRVHAVVLATGTNCDGRTHGMALPSTQSQAALLERVYREAGVHPDRLGYVEAHGTGTRVGDAAECAALGQVLGWRRASALPIGSVKTNVGHLEAASGMASLVKALMVLKRREIPASLHGTPANPAIDFDALGLAPVHVGCGLAADSLVGVNNFGFGGANAHVVLASAPEQPARVRPVGRILPVVVSARSAEALVRAVRETGEVLSRTSPEDFYDVAYTLCRRRTRHEHRAVVLAEEPARAARELAAVTVSEAPNPRARDGIAFAFSGNGSQWAGMGTSLLGSQPVFREAVRTVDAELRPLTGWSVVEELAASTAKSRLSDTVIAQPLLFAVQVGLAALLRANGVVPRVVFGHSVGEVAAAYVAGALDLSTAARVIAERSAAQGETAGRGRMAAVGLSSEQAHEVVAGFAGRVEIAAINSDRDVTISGDGEALRELGEKLGADGVFFRHLDLDYAFHSHAMDPVRQRIRTGLAEVRSQEPHTPLLSTVTGELVRAGDLDAEHWWRNIREPVLFARTAAHLPDHGVGIVVEVGPHPVLSAYLDRLGGDHERLLPIRTLSRGDDGERLADRVAAAVVTAGGDLEWRRFFPVAGVVRDLPRYPWRHEHFWKGDPERWTRTPGTGRMDHPLLGERMPVAEPSWHSQVEPARTPWPAEHRVGGAVVLPATAYVEMALAAGRLVLDGPVELDGLRIRQAMVLSWAPDTVHQVQVSLSEEDGALRVAGREGSDGHWQVHAQGRVRAMVAPPPPSVVEASESYRRITGDTFYGLCDRAGLEYGPLFRCLREVRVGDGEVWADYRFDAPQDGYEVHPALLDGALQAGAALLGSDFDRGRASLPVSIGRVRMWRQPPSRGHVHVRMRSTTSRETCWDVTVTDETGAVAVELAECRLRPFATAPTDDIGRFDTVLRAQPRLAQPAAPWPLTGPHDLIAACAQTTPAVLGPGMVQIIKRINGHFLRAAVAELLPGRTSFTLDDLTAAGTQSRHLPLVRILLEVAVQEGLVHSAGSEWLIGADADVTGLTREALRRFPAVESYLLLQGRCGLHLADVLRGANDPAELAFTGADLEEALFDLYGAHSTGQYNAVIRDLVSAVARDWPADRPLRVLEVGAGTGATTVHVLPVLPPERTRYVVSDLSTVLLDRARTRFAQYDFAECRRLDLDRDPAEQGFAVGEFDVVIAANVLHATADLGAALRGVAGLLAPGGLLVAAEVHDTGFLALPFGLLDGFWRFTDAPLRVASPLLPREKWTALLSDSGFAEVGHIAGASESVLVASTPIDRDASRMSVAAASGSLWCVVVEDFSDSSRAEAVSCALRSAGAEVELVGFDLGKAPRLARRDDLAGVVVILGGPLARDPAEQTAQRAAVVRGLAVGSEARTGGKLPVWLVTRPSGVFPAPEAPLVPLDSAVWGIGRTIANEHFNLVSRRISWDDRGDPAADAHRVVAELLVPSDEDEIVLTAGGRFVPRVVKGDRPPLTSGPAVGVGFRLAVEKPGLGYRLNWEPHDFPQPGPGEVLVEVRAAGLNYHDVMVAAALLPPEADADGRADLDHSLGLECAGVVTAVGVGVAELRPGDRVFGYATASFASHVLVRVDAVGRIPDSMSYTEAATIPAVWWTVHHSLNDLAHLDRGETILVHAASGGVGLAAVHLATSRGARVIATAGTDAKRDFLRMCGVEHVLDSRSTAFADQAMDLTGGRGVDVVLNSLSGEAMSRGLEVLAPHGRFVELGKRDIYRNSRLPMHALRKNISLLVVDIADMPTGNPRLAARHLREVVASVHAGDYPALPHRVHPAARIADAFRLMQHARHVGKVVISFDEPVDVRPAKAPLVLDPAATYLVTGGLGGFGAATARRLADRGARHLTLVGRRGHHSPEAPVLLDDLLNRGVQVAVHAADVTDPQAMASVRDGIAKSGRPLRGVFHAAMVLDDRPLADTDDVSFRAALDPKLCGVLLLEELVEGHTLDFFVAYSSVTALVGNARQANYVAANLYLEAHVRSRRRRGLPALAVQWGAISDTGYVAREGMGALMAKSGLPSMSAERALDVVEDAVAEQRTDVVAVGRFDWQGLRDHLVLLGTPRFAGLLPPGSDVENTTSDAEEETATTIEEYLLRHLAVAMRTTPERIDRATPLTEIGVDSFIAMELLVDIRERFGIQLSSMDLMKASTSLAGLAQLVVDRR